MSHTFSFDDYMLTRAMHAIMDDEIAALPSDEELADSIEASDEFRSKMQLLTVRTKHRRTFRHAMTAMAAVFAGVILIFSATKLMEGGFFAGSDSSDYATGSMDSPVEDAVDDGVGDSVDEAAPGADDANAPVDDGAGKDDTGTDTGAGGGQTPEEVYAEIVIRSIRGAMEAIGKVYFPGVWK